MSDSRGLTYVTVVPNNGAQWRLHRLDDSEAEGSLSISDADPPANSNPDRPWVLRSRITLRAGAQSSYFHLDRSLTAAFRAGDTIHIASTARGGVGVAVWRDRQLVVAVGAVSAALTDGDVSVRVAPELWEQAVFLTVPDPGAQEDLRQTYRDERPVEIRIAGKKYLFFRRNETIHGIHVFVKHGFYVGGPNATGQPSVPASRGQATEKDECVALARISLCSRVGATTSAYLLAADGLGADPECGNGY
jgi:hypothetical protein